MENNIKYLEIDAGVRYWEDAYLNEEEDSSGSMPGRSGDRWKIKIDLMTGEIVGWPKGSSAKIHYKVCDDGEYWLLNEGHERLYKWAGFYVPNSILCIGDDGFGDYIIFQIDETGKINNWKYPVLKTEEWITT